MSGIFGDGDTEIGAGLSRARTGSDFTASHLVHAMNGSPRHPVQNSAGLRISSVESVTRSKIKTNKIIGAHALSH